MTAVIDPLRLAELAARGLSDSDLGEYFGCSARTILRRRRKLRIRSAWTPSKAPHGTEARYTSHLCRCAPCKAAHAVYHGEYVQERYQAPTVYAPRLGEPWNSTEDQQLVELGAIRASMVLERTYFACVTRLGKLRRAS